MTGEGGGVIQGNYDELDLIEKGPVYRMIFNLICQYLKHVL